MMFRGSPGALPARGASKLGVSHRGSRQKQDERIVDTAWLISQMVRRQSSHATAIKTADERGSHIPRPRRIASR